MRVFLNSILLIVVGFYAGAGHAAGSLGDNVMELAANVNSLVSGVCFVIGIGLLGGAAIQYKQHRRNRLMTPISKPIFMFILGAILVCVPLLGYIAPGGEILASQTY